MRTGENFCAIVDAVSHWVSAMLIAVFLTLGSLLILDFADFNEAKEYDRELTSQRSSYRSLTD